MVAEYLPPDRYQVHVSEGSLFLWLRLNMSITSQELYERLKSRGVLIVPGEYFFFALNEPWSHHHQCIRLTFSMPDEVVRTGIEILADEHRLIRQALDSFSLATHKMEQGINPPAFIGLTPELYFFAGAAETAESGF